MFLLASGQHELRKGSNCRLFRSQPLIRDDALASQAVYGKLEEPDGLAGLARLRSGGALLSDQLLAAEKAGSWSEALGLHEQVGPMHCHM